MLALKTLAAAVLVLALGRHSATAAAMQSLLTAPLNCINPTLQAQDTSDVAILCDSKVVERASLSGVTSLEVDVLSPTLTMKTLVSDTLEKLFVHSDNASDTTYTSARPVIELDAGFSELSKLTTLRFQNVNFKTPSLSIKTPDALETLTIDGTNAEELALTMLPGTNPKLQTLDLPHNAFTSLPKCLYARPYASKSLTVNIEITGTTFEVLDAASYKTLDANLATNASPTFALATGCDFDLDVVTTSGDYITDGKYKVCDEATIVGMPKPRNTTAASAATSAPPTTATTTASTNTSSNMPLVVLVVLVATVAVALAGFLTHKHLVAKQQTSARSSDSALLDLSAVNLIAKIDTSTTASGIAALVSTDETLRALRLDRPILLRKSVGAGQLWIGEYDRTPVIVKRIEAAVSDPSTTKRLMAHVCDLAPLAHANIVTLRGVTYVAGTDFAVVAEFMDHDNLKSVLSDPEVDLDTHAKLAICLDIARALAYLHSPERNMYVRRLSSRKVLVHSTSLACKVNVLDCYPSVQTTSSVPVESYGAGELVWLAPEVVTRAVAVDPKQSNIYALGVLMCEIFTRTSPYQSFIDECGNTLADLEIARRMRSNERLAPHEHHAEYMYAPQRLRDTIEQCLATTPSDRPTVEAIVVALEDAKADEIAASVRTGGDFFV